MMIEDGAVSEGREGEGGSGFYRGLFSVALV